MEFNDEELIAYPKDKKQCCGNCRKNWTSATLRPMVVMVLFALILIENVVKNKLQILLCHRYIENDVSNFDQKIGKSNCTSLIEDPPEALSSDFGNWFLYKDTIVFLPSIFLGPIIALVFHNLPSQKKFIPILLAPAGVTVCAIVLAVGYNYFDEPVDIIYSLIPVGFTGGTVVLGLLAYAFVAYETVGKPSERLTEFVSLQVTFMVGRALGGILLALLSVSIQDIGFCILSAVLGLAALAFVATKTRLELDEFELILAGLRFKTDFSTRAFHTGLLFLCAVVHALTGITAMPYYGAVSYTLEASGLMIVLIVIQVQIRKRIIQHRLLPKYEPPMIGLVGWGTMFLARLIYLVPASGNWAPYVASTVNSISQLGIAMSYYLLCLNHPKGPGLGMLWAALGGILGSIPSEPLFSTLENATTWAQLVYLVQALLLLVPFGIFLYFYYYFTKGKGASKKNLGDDENAAFFQRDLKRSYGSGVDDFIQ